MSKETGGKAFPGIKKTEKTRFGEFDRTEEGMTLRDYFAAKAMQGFMANKDRPMTFHPDDDAAYAYAIADAMLRAREAS